MYNTMRLRNERPKTIKSYLHYFKRFIAHIKISPAGSTPEELVRSFLTRIVINENVSATTQKVAMCSIVYFFKRVIQKPLGDFSGYHRATKAKNIPVVLSREEAGRFIDSLSGIALLWGYFMYGCGLRLGEVCALRVKDIDFDRRQIAICDAKGGKYRYVLMPERMVPELERHMRNLRRIYEEYAARRVPVSLPYALDRKYPNAPYEYGWFYLFPATEPIKMHPGRRQDPAWIGKLHHIHESAIQKRVKRAYAEVGITKKAGCHTLRHSYATHWLEQAEGAHEVALLRLGKLLGHGSPKTTLIYLHCIKHKSDVASPLDTLGRAA